MVLIYFLDSEPLLLDDLVKIGFYMKKIIMFTFLSLFLSSCCLVHRMDIEQGNIITQDMLNQLHRGMSRAQVVALMGSPVTQNTFNDNRVDYIYTFKPGCGQMTASYLILTFINDRLYSNLNLNRTFSSTSSFFRVY